MIPPPPPEDARRARPGAELALALLLGALAYGISCLLVRSAGAVFGFGSEYQAMSERPFDLPGALPHRLLAPLLAHLVGLGGERYPLFAHGLAALLLATVALVALRRAARPLDAALVALAVAVTAPVQMYKRHWVGYPDPLGYALFFGALLAARRPAVFWSLFLANLLNHELALFLLPWLWFLRREAGGSWRADVVGASAALGLYGAFYLVVKARASGQIYSSDHFLEHPLFPGGTFVVLSLAVVHVVVAFGPIAAVLAWDQHARHATESRRERAHLWLVLAGIALIFCIAFDWQRHTNLIVLPLVPAALRFLAAGHRALFAVLLTLGIGLMAWIPPWEPVTWITTTLVQPAFAAGVVIAGQASYGFGPLSAALTRWVPAVAPVLAACFGLAALAWIGGAWIARRDRRA